MCCKEALFAAGRRQTGRILTMSPAGNAVSTAVQMSGLRVAAVKSFYRQGVSPCRIFAFPAAPASDYSAVVHEVLHLVSAPLAVAGIAESDGGVEAFGVGVALIHEQGGGQTEGGGTPADAA